MCYTIQHTATVNHTTISTTPPSPRHHHHHYTPTPTQDTAVRVKSQLKRLARAIYSNPPVHGARIVAEVVGDEGLFDEWKGEMEMMAGRIKVLGVMVVGCVCVGWLLDVCVGWLLDACV